MGNALKTAFLLAVMGGLMVLIGDWLGGRSGMIIAFGIAIVMNFFSYWFSDKIVLAMYRAQEVTPQEAPELHAIVDRLAARDNIPKPKVYIIPDAAPNAFATGRNPSHAAVAATQGILEILSADELEGVLAHELSHVKNRDILIGTIAATMAMAITMLARMAQWAAIFGGVSRDREDRGGGGLIGLLAMAILAPIAALLIQMAVSRSREYQADRSGAELSGKPLGLAHALQKLQRGSQIIPMQAEPATAHMFIVNPFSGAGLASLFSTHPPTEERIRRLEAMSTAPDNKP